jgi:tetratricopeptide (TPR) repeat protein
MSNGWTKDEIDLVAERAYELCQQGKYREAFTIFEGLLAIDTRNVYCLESLAALCLTLGSPESALEYATAALTFSPRSPEALTRRCEAYLLLGRITPAQQDLDVLRQLRVNAQVRRLTLRMANTVKNANNLLPRATIRQIER